MKTKRVLLNIVRVFGFIITAIGCIWSIPVAIGAILGYCVILPGIKMWQWAADQLDDDKEIHRHPEIVMGSKTVKGSWYKGGHYPFS